ncbi:phosphonate metabolism protein PhnP [Vibrio genomosp. F10]|uniref:phosphonate metabolism protein PhnP n=1 Tax=Vibrio genomosp. F10 TaxID=723171 RepID=UPI0002F513E2|nr:phosphonate metabolism protein PhnP [Vibrio genomosp. F10]OEF04826.1 phosphonate metabolism protein PhnP [Vibrio genomosp. F10 str. 9ZB36]
MLTLTLLGTGAAGGVPLYGCECTACAIATENKERERKPCSAMVEWGDGESKNRLLIDAGIMDLHRRFKSGSYLGFLLTHFHVDHVQGLFHLRWGNGASIPVWCPNDPLGCADLLKHSGCLQFIPEMTHARLVNIEGLRVTPLQMRHSRPTVGYLFEYEDQSIAYLTDTDGLPNETLQFLSDRASLDTLVIDCSFPPQHSGSNHGNIDTAKEIQKLLAPKKLVITHIGHDLDDWLIRNEAPDSVIIGYDDMIVL